MSTVAERAPTLRPIAATQVADSRDPLSGLTPAQAAAARHRGPPLLVIAGPGSGKTATLAARAASLVLEGLAPSRLLLLTFSRRAAHELTARTAGLLARAGSRHGVGAGPALPWAGTFHSIGARLLHIHADALALQPGFTVLDRADAEDLLAIERAALGLAATHGRRFPLKGTCLSIYSRVLGSGAELASVLEREYPWCAPQADGLRALFGAYERAKQRQGVLDYDDLLQCWIEAMADPEFAASVRGRFDEVLVDEAQDCNAQQMRLLDLLKPDGQGLTLVGDDAQSIYGFRGAEARHLLDRAARDDGRTRVLALERNFRSTPELVAASNAVIAEAARRLPKTMTSERASGPRVAIVAVEDEAVQAAWAADEVLRLRESGIALRRQAVLFRSATHSVALELELARRGIPFVKYGGLRFVEAAHVKDVLSLLRWVENPAHALAGYRCAMLVPGIGPSRARGLQEALSADPHGGWHAVADVRAPGLDTAALQDLREVWRDLREPGGDARWPAALTRALAWYRPHLERLHPDAPSRWQDLQQLERLAAGYPSCARFLAEITLDPPSASGVEAGEPLRDEDWLVLSTIHSAKGQEWTAVQVLSVVDGCLPADLATGSQDEIEEERRLLYVAMTRARDRLALIVPHRFHVTQQTRFGDRHVHALPSRFLTPGVRAVCEDVAGVRPRVDAESAPVDPSSGCPASTADRAARGPSARSRAARWD